MYSSGIVLFRVGRAGRGKMPFSTAFYLNFERYKISLLNLRLSHEKTYKIQYLVQNKKIIHNKLTIPFLLARILISATMKSNPFLLRNNHAR
jgi:hypothetical protein